jgi:predicted  nucleic acid-binding Zn-ribbon protein
LKLRRKPLEKEIERSKIQRKTNLHKYIKAIENDIANIREKTKDLELNWKNERNVLEIREIKKEMRII